MALTLTGTLVIDCNDLSCLTFTDTTGAYSPSNTGGYGAPNPTIPDIVSVDFVITDSNATDWSYLSASYTPSANGDRHICLTEGDFVNGMDTLDLVAGQSYTLTYTVNYSGDSFSIQKDFTFPCCGNAITSNLATNFTIQQNIGCGSFVFTDTTGTYNAQTNVGGYGTPNPAYADITSTAITFVLSNGQTVTIDTFVPTQSVPYITIQAVDLGYSGVVPDQIMEVTYSVYVAGDCRVGYKKSSVLLSCNTETCINNKIQSVLNGDCACLDDNCNQTDLVFNMLMELDVLKIAATRNMSCINGKIEALYRKCSGGGCTNC